MGATSEGEAWLSDASTLETHENGLSPGRKDCPYDAPSFAKGDLSQARDAGETCKTDPLALRKGGLSKERCAREKYKNVLGNMTFGHHYSNVV